jgi:dTDP-4-dehydrorhamnose 3,5-epimerase
MIIEGVKSLGIADIKVITYKKFMDFRGHFCETINKPQLTIFNDYSFVQFNESRSNPFTVRGLHFQTSPPMGKLVRTIYGHMIDVALDIRRDSKTFGKIIMYEMPSDNYSDFGEWIWIPPGFAHGVVSITETIIEYACTSTWNKESEESISVYSRDIDWSLCDKNLKKCFEVIMDSTPLISEKDKNAIEFSSWRHKL